MCPNRSKQFEHSRLTLAESELEVELDELINFYLQGLSDSTLSRDDRIAYSLNLANSLCDRFDANGEDSDLEQAVSRGEDALRMVNIRDEVALTIMSDLSTIYLARFEKHGNVQDLDKALDSIQKAADGTAVGDSHHRFLRLTNLGNTLCTSYECYGHEPHLESAISKLQEALDLGSPEDDLKAKCLSNKAKALYLRYEGSGVISDLLEAVQVSTDSFNIAEDSITKSTCALNLTAHLLELAERRCDDETIENAIIVGQIALGTFPEDHPMIAMCCHNLSYLYRLRYERVDDDGDRADLRQATAYAIRALDIPSIGSQERAMYSDHLGLLHHLKYQISQDPLDLDNAIQSAEAAVEHSDAEGPGIANYSNHLVDLLKARSESCNSVTDLDRAFQIGMKALENEVSTPLVRIATLYALALMHVTRKQWGQAKSYMVMALELIPKLARNSLQRENQEHLLGQVTGMSQLAASLRLQAGDSAALAFETLETGRGIITGLALQLRDDFRPVHTENVEAKDLLQRYEELRKLICLPWPTSQAEQERNIPLSVLVSRRQAQIKELEILEQQVRSIPGLENFQRSLSEADLKELAGQGYVVSFNVTTIRSDAFIITSHSIEVLPLPSLKFHDLAEHLKSVAGKNKITEPTLRTLKRTNERMLDLLSWLWEVAVKPVLRHLHLLNPPQNSPLPRIHWITSGALSLMPLHAAGKHTSDSTDYTMRFVVSSYVLDTKRLAWSAECLRRLSDSAASEKSLFIAMPTTPGEADLDMDSESEAFLMHMPNAVRRNSLSSRDVIELLFDASTVHFACHAQADGSDPSAGSLLLYNKDKNAVDHLTIRELANLNLPYPRLAYLSACQTADIQSLDLIDETIHLAGTFQAVGFPHVIGTYWQADHEIASQIATSFYRRFGECMRPVANADARRQARTMVPDVAWILHQAVLEARVEDPETPFGWANFVHFGL